MNRTLLLLLLCCVLNAEEKPVKPPAPPGSEPAVANKKVTVEEISRRMKEGDANVINTWMAIEWASTQWNDNVTNRSFKYSKIEDEGVVIALLDSNPCSFEDSIESVLKSAFIIGTVHRLGAPVQRAEVQITIGKKTATVSIPLKLASKMSAEREKLRTVSKETFNKFLTTCDWSEVKALTRGHANK